jgi:hypothetical protein
VCYVLWGILHIGVGAVVLYQLSAKGGIAALALIGNAVPAEELPQSLGGVASGVLAEHAWNVALFGFFAVIVGAVLNWRNSRIGYWLNLCVVSAEDLGLIFTILIPGYIRPFDGWSGPVLWVLAVIFSTIGFLQVRVRQARNRMPPNQSAAKGAESMPGTSDSSGFIHPTLHHYGLVVSNTQAMLDWYGKVLGTSPVRQSAKPAGAQTPRGARANFVSNDKANHRIVFITVPWVTRGPGAEPSSSPPTRGLRVPKVGRSVDQLCAPQASRH